MRIKTMGCLEHGLLQKSSAYENSMEEQLNK